MLLILSRLIFASSNSSLQNARTFVENPSSTTNFFRRWRPWPLKRFDVRELLAVVNGFVSLLLLSFAFSSSAFSQGCGFVKEKELSRGPISFSGLKQSQFTILSSGDVDGIKHCIIRYTASGGDFSYDNDKGNVFKGTIVSFRLKADLTPLQGANGATLNIQPGDLDVTLNTSNQITVGAYGGFVHLAAKQEVQISNPSEIFIQSPAINNPATSKGAKINQTGLLQIRTSNQLNWIGAVFKFPELPSTLTLDLVAPKANTLDKDFELPLDSGLIRIVRAPFNYALPSSVTKKTLPVNGSAYRAIIKHLEIGEFLADLQRDSLGVRIKDISGDGEFTGRAMETPNPAKASSAVAVLFTGKASVARLTGLAAFSKTVADVQNIKITGLRLKATGKQEDHLAVNFSKPSLRAHHDLVQSVSSISQSFQATIDDPTLEPASPVALQPEDYYSPSAAQVGAMRELGIQPLSDQQRAAIADSRVQLGKVVSADFLINYPANDFKQLLPQIAARHGLKVLDTKCGRQELLVLASFGNGADAPTTLGQSDAMKFVFRIAPSIGKRLNPDTNKEEPVLILRYTMGLARIDQTSLTDTLSPDDISGAISNQLGQADSTSEDPTPLTIVMPVNITKSFDLNKSFTDTATKSTVTIHSKKVEAVVSVLNTVLLIDERGIHLIGVLEAK